MAIDKILVGGVLTAHIPMGGDVSTLPVGCVLTAHIPMDWIKY